jgi:hypothetical protein
VATLEVIRGAHAAYEQAPAPVLVEARRDFRVSLYVLQP